MLSVRQRILALAMASVGALAWWLHQGEEPPDAAEGDREYRPDYTVDNIRVTIMDESGALHQQLTAVELRHYPDDGSKELKDSNLTLYGETGPPWLIRSEKAWISGDNHLIRMQGAVRIDRVTGSGTRPVHMTTSELLLKRNEHYAETDQPVRITSEVDWMTSENGARVWLEDKLRVKLLGPIRGEMLIPRTDEELR